VSDLDRELEALRAEPTSDRILARALEAAGTAGRSDVAASAWRARAEGLVEANRGSEAALAFARAGDIEREDRGEVEAASAAYRRALALEPEDQHALYGLALALHARAAWDELLALYRAREARSDAPGRRATFHLFASEILDEKLRDTEAALDEILEAVRIAPDNLRLISRLVELGERAGRAEDAAIAIGEMMMHADEADVRAALSYRLAQLYLGQIPQKDRALAYLRSALFELEEDPDQLDDVDDAASIREHLDALEARFSERTRDRRVAPQPVRLERELARIYEHDHHDHRRALMALTRALDYSPEDRELQEEVMRLGLMADDLNRVAETFERVADRTDNALLRSFLRLRLGHLYGQALRRPAEAIRVYMALLAEEPGHVEARRRLEPLLERLGRRSEQVDLLEAALAAPDAKDRQRTLEKLERLYLQLGRSEDLERIEERIRLETGDPAVSPLVADLDEAHQSSSGTGPISGFHLQPRIQRLEAALEGPSASTARRAFVELTRILIDEREDFEQAEAIAERGLERFPDETSLLELLEDIHRRQQRWDAVVTILRRRLEVAESVEARLAVRKALAHLFEAKLDDKRRALEVLAQAEEEGPFDLEVSRERERLLLEAMDWGRLRTTLERRLSAAEDERLAALTRASLARLAYDVDMDLERAWLLLRDASRDAPFEPDVLELAAEVAARRRDVERAVELYERLASLLDGPRAASSLVAAGRLTRSRLADVDRAEAAFESALAADPACRPAVEALADLARERRDWSRALAWLVRSAELSIEPSIRAERLAEAARVAEEELGDEQQAAVLYQSTLEIEPERTDVRARAARLVEADDPALAHDLFVTAGQRGGDSEQSAEWMERAGLAAERAGDRQRAVEAYRGALWIEPRRRRSLVRLAVLRELDGAWEEVHDLASRYLLWHESNGSDEERSAAYLRMARAKHHLGEWEAAARFARQALSLEETLDGHRLLAESLEGHERWLEAAEAHRRVAVVTDDEQARVAALSRAGELFGERAREPARAAVVLARALELRPDDAALCERLARYRHLSGDTLGASEAHRRRADHLHGAPRAAALRAAATWAWSQNRRAAADACRVALEAELGADAAFDLARLWEYDGDVEHVAPFLLAVGKAQASAGRFESASRVLAEAAELASVRAFDGPRAAEACDAIRALDGDGRWDVLRAWIADRRAEAGELAPERAARAWLDVLGPHAGHAEALEGVERWLFRGDRPRPAAFVRTLRIDDDAAAPLLEAPVSPFDLRATPPVDPLSRVLSEFGGTMLDHLRDGWRGPAPRRRLDLGSLPESVAGTIRRAIGRLRGEADPIEVWAIDARDTAVAPLWVDGRSALGIDPSWAAALSEADLAFAVGFAVGASEPDVFPWIALDRGVFVETLLGLLPAWPKSAPYDAKRAARRVRSAERGLTAEGRAHLAAALRHWEPAVRAARAHACARSMAGGLVACLSWSTVRRQSKTLPLGPVRPWWPRVVRFATGRAFLGWACGLTEG
jgi:Tfp pilus assembly protein PilF